MDKLKGYQVRVAESKETEAVLSFLKGAAHSLKEKGVDQWTSVLDGEDDGEVSRMIEQKQTYIVEKDNHFLATFTISPRASSWDDMLWGKTKEDAVYLHKLAVLPSETGKGLGREILGWLETDLKGKGVHRLRLDCIANNEKLNTFYTNAGFQKTGINHGFSLFEKQL